MSEDILVYGAGGFAREVAWLVDSSSGLSCAIRGFVDDSPEPPSPWSDPRPVMSYEKSRESFPSAGYAVGIGSPATRRAVTDRLLQDGRKLPALVHSGVQVSERVAIGNGNIICAGCILTVDIRIADHVHINLDCTIGHDVRIGEYATISPGVHVSGNVTIEEDVFIGTGAVIVNGAASEPLVIGRGSVIAAGACITRSTDRDCLYAGVPATMKKRLR